MQRKLPSDVAVVFETRAYSEPAAAALADAGRSGGIVNPARFKRFAQSQFSRHTTDRADAKLLTTFAQVFAQRAELELWHPPRWAV